MKQYLEYIYNEKETVNATKQVAEILLSKLSKYGIERHSQFPKRLSNTQQLPTEKIQSLVQRIFKDARVKVLPPKHIDNPSGTFDLFIIKTPYGVAKINFAGKKTEGHKFESGVIAKLQTIIDKDTDNDPDAEDILKRMGIDVNSVTAVTDQSKSDTRRSQLFGFQGPQLVGKQIADLSITADGEEHYISVKEKNATYIFNSKNIKFIKKDTKDINKNKIKDEIVFDKKLYSSDDIVAQIFDLLNINPKRIARGLNDYVKNTETESGDWENTNIKDTAKLKKLLASAYGYGYWLLIEKNDGSIILEHLYSAKDTMNLIGNVASAQVKYPYIKSKVADIKIICNTKTETVKYYISMRNAKGGIVPIDFRIKREPVGKGK